MSGPKCVEFDYSRRERERQENRNRCAAAESEYARLEGEFVRLRNRLAELESVPGTEWIERTRLKEQVAALLAGQNDREAARVFSEAVSRARSAVESTENRLKDGIVELNRRFRELERARGSLAVEKESLGSATRSSIPENWPQKEKADLLSILEEILRGVTAPGVIKAELNRNGVAQLAQAESVAAKSARTLEEGKARIQRVINEVHGRLLTARLLANVGAPRTLADFLKATLKPSLPSPEEDKTLAKLDEVIAKVATLQETGGWSALLRKAEAIRQEQDAGRRLMLYESLVIECSSTLKSLRLTAQFQREVDALIDGVAHLNGASVEGLVEELRSLHRAGRVLDLTEIRGRLKKVVTEEEHRQERERKRRAVVEALIELGYEVEDGNMQTALVEAGKIVFQKPGDGDYALEMVTDGDLHALQTRIIRYAEGAETTGQQRLRDKEREDAWCTDHDRLLAKVSERGWEAAFKQKIPAGAVPVKVVVDASRARSRRRATAAVESASMRRRTSGV